MAHDINEISYDISKKATDMMRGFTIQTNYGDLRIDSKDAAPFVMALHKLLNKKLDVIARGKQK